MAYSYSCGRQGPLIGLAMNRQVSPVDLFTLPTRAKLPLYYFIGSRRDVPAGVFVCRQLVCYGIPLLSGV